MKSNHMFLMVLILSLVASSFFSSPADASQPVIPAPGDHWVAPTSATSTEEAVKDLESHSLIQLKNTKAQVSAYKRQGRIKHLYGQAFSHGASPEESANSFIQANAGLFSVDPGDVTGQHLQPIMYERDTGRYKFTAVSYSQSKDGIPVFGSRVVLLVRNEAGYPLVLASSDLKNLGDFKPQTGQVQANPSAGIAKAQSVSPSLVNFTQPKMVIWAGVDDEIAQPVLAYSFIGDNGRPADGINPERYSFVTDAATGEILYMENLIIFVDVEGNVKGKATQNKGADFCEEELPEAMPWARVNIGSTVAYADSMGDFVIPNGGSSPVTVESRLWGLWFSVANEAGANSVLYDTVTPPGPASFMHNDLNSSEFVRAEVNGYLQANVVRSFTLVYNPSYPGLQQSDFPVYVNAVGGYCPGNAWYDGYSITFCQAGGSYPNTAWSTVIHHEYGHHLVAMAGSGQGAYGEGMGDVMGVLITDDAGTGYGFYGNCNSPLRNANNTLQYPCNGEIHYCGQLLSGCVWSTRNELLITNPSTYRDIISNLAINAMLLHTGTSIDPSITVDYLTLDDDNGDLNDGTPHYNEIAAGFGTHNMDAPELQLLSFFFPYGLPEIISPEGGTTLRVEVSSMAGEPQPGTGMMYVNDGLGWDSIPMSQIEPNVYDAIFPALECGATELFYFKARTTDGRSQNWPRGAPAEAFNAVSAISYEVKLSDNFNQDLGWTVQNDPYLTDGAWVRGIPVGGGDRGDPPTDFDGSGYCYLTDNTYGNSDVDGGITWLISPSLDLSHGIDAKVHYALWYTNNFGDDPNNDLFKVYVSNNGGASWTLTQTIGPVTSEGWKEYSFMVGDYVPLTNLVKVRFEASDLNAESVVEAGVDAVDVSVYQCATCGDVNGDSQLNLGDVVYLISYLYKLGPLPQCVPVTACGDANMDGRVEVGDVVYLVNYLYRGGSLPCNP
jgi:hypothetical protein